MYGCGKEGNLPLVCLNPTAGISKWEPLHKQSSCILSLMSTQSTTIPLPLLVTAILKMVYKASKITNTKIALKLKTVTNGNLQLSWLADWCP